MLSMLALFATPGAPKCPSQRATPMVIPVPDWTTLPGELLQVISEKLDNCFDVVHSRSVCHPWRSTMPFPACLLRPSYSLPSFAEFPSESKGMSTLTKIPLFLVTAKAHPPADFVSPCEFVMGGVRGDEPEEDLMELLPSPLQCSVKTPRYDPRTMMQMGLNIPRYYHPFLLNMLDCHVFPLGHHYRWGPEDMKTDRGLAFLPLNKDGRRGGGGGFAVLINYMETLLVLRSDEMKWMQVKQSSDNECRNVASFRGRFYASFENGDISVLDPYSLTWTPQMPSQLLDLGKFLVTCGDDEELFLVEKFHPNYDEAFDLHFLSFTCKVSRLDEKAGKWVDLAGDLGGRVLFIGHYGNVCFSGEELPDGCGLSGNSIVFTNELLTGVTFVYKYGVDTGDAEDDPNCWRFSMEYRVKLFRQTPVLTLQVFKHPTTSADMRR
ncbi:unnamed protein product [Microthlaspi erraticum]|uniref:KIB1-4 beta-propeller domain-containing protein n=1 Tax=Microthlaspi erraticum TaxID=1685480 RepID=A0A6D2JDY1_9BRAS|nr:unnamed protein product [Microthlaspi erraticum]